MELAIFQQRCLPLLFMIALAGSDRLRAEETLPGQLQPFLNKHCVACHAGERPEGGLDLKTLSVDLSDANVRRRWIFLFDRVAAGEMPPKEEERPDAEAKARFLKHLGDALTAADRAGREIVLRRLNRREYENSVRDLFDIHADVSRLLPADSVDQGFDTTGSALSLSAEQLALYVEAADLVLDQVFGPPAAPKSVQKTVNIKDLRSKTTADQVLDDGVVLFSGAKSLPLYGASVKGPATYRLRIQVKAVQSERPVIMKVYGGMTGRIPGHIAGFFEVPPGKMTTIELTDRAVEGSDTFAIGLVGGFPWWSVDAESYKGAGLFVGDIQIEGPLEKWPPPSRERLLGDVDPAKGSIDDIRAILSRVVPRAFRRSLAKDEIEPFVALSKQALDEGQSF